MGADADEQLYPYLKCNIINCRATLTNIAIVTSCSCVDGRLINPGPNVPICPACGTALAEEGDIGHIQTTIPDNCQKVVLAGLHPIVISTLVDHGLRFWAYQAAQEIVYQEYVLNTARNDSKELSIDYERAINEATSKVETLTAQLEAITLTNQELVHKNNELGESFREKTSRCKKLQGELDRLRRKNLISHTQNAAAAIDQTISQPVPPGTSSGAARLSDMNAVPASPMRQNQLSGGEIGGQIPFTNGTNMSNILRGFEQHDSAMGNGNGDMSRVAMPPPNARVAGSGNMHANTRIGAAHNTSWPINALRENMGRSHVLYVQY
ncbi:E3 ubiquitin-protein ligase [Drechslerella dactyloides]|uniref:E3 ubiquitin-protein ligase n=1 Tax=Drechslerella dactyloides TaxID=74499 RepID=A0AAD6IZH0_DREDA|nr:E3 ubiquitin-protein ligase [Drechslerella dactyloides]